MKIFIKVLFLLLFVISFKPGLPQAVKNLGEKEIIKSSDIRLVKNNKFPNPNFDRIQELTSRLGEARLAGDKIRAEQLEAEIRILSGSRHVNYNNDDNIKWIPVNKPIGESTEINVTRLSSETFRAHAISTDYYSGVIWVAGSQYNPSGPDTIRIIASTNNGISWMLIGKITSNAGTFGIRNDEIDIEAVNDGTGISGSYAFLVFGYNEGTAITCKLFRTKIDGSGNMTASLFPQSSSALRQHHPRIVSDNAKYTSTAYLYIITSQDSVRSSGGTLYSQKFFVGMSLFNFPVTLESRNYGTDYSFSWAFAHPSDTIRLINDIAFGDSLGRNTIIATFFSENYIDNTVFFAYSYNFGATAPTYKPQFTEPNKMKKIRLSFTGLNNTTALMTYLKFFSGNDWDPLYARSTNFGVNWVTGYFNSSNEETVSSDNTGIAGTNGMYKYSFTNNSSGAGKVFYGTFNAVNGYFTTPVQINSVNSSLTFGPEKAGYKKTGDSCIGLWTGIGGNGEYVSYGCSGAITGIGNSNKFPSTFALYQNYPNPFNPTTKIRFEVPLRKGGEGVVSLIIYDILGREIKTLVNEQLKPGTYEVTFNAGDLPSGIYFYQLKSENFIETKKLILLK